MGEGEELSTLRVRQWRSPGEWQVLSPSPVVLPLEVLELLWQQGDSKSTLPGHSISPLHGLEDFASQLSIFK